MTWVSCLNPGGLLALLGWGLTLQLPQGYCENVADPLGLRDSSDSIHSEVLH